MKIKINISILIFVLIFAVAACTKSKDPETSNYSINSSQSSEASNSAESIEANIKSNKQIVDAIFCEIYGYYIKDGVDYADSTMNEAEKLSDRYLGKITSEEDAKEKADAAWIKIGGEGYTDDEKPFEAKYYKEYDAWLINGAFKSTWVDSSSRQYIKPGGVDYIIIRASNGEVLAVWGDA